MRKTILTVLASLAMLVSSAQDKPAYRIYTAEGDKADYGMMIKALAKADIIFVGETHN